MIYKHACRLLSLSCFDPERMAQRGSHLAIFCEKVRSRPASARRRAALVASRYWRRSGELRLWSSGWRRCASRLAFVVDVRHRKAVRIFDDEARAVGFLERPGRGKRRSAIRPNLLRAAAQRVRPVFHFEPVRRAAGTVWRAEPLGHDALAAERATFHVGLAL